MKLRNDYRIYVLQCILRIKICAAQSNTGNRRTSTKNWTVDFKQCVFASPKVRKSTQKQTLHKRTRDDGMAVSERAAF